MSISDLFDNEFKSRNKGHFSAIVRVAMTDGNVSEEEKKFLEKLATKLEISHEEFEEILENKLAKMDKKGKSEQEEDDDDEDKVEKLVDDDVQNI